MKPKTIILICLFVLFISACAIGAYIIAKREKPPTPEVKIDLSLKCKDWYSGEPCSTDFSLEDQNGTVYLTGAMKKDVWNVFNNSVPAGRTYYLWAGLDNDHYPTKRVLMPQYESYTTIFNAVKKTESVDITHTGTIKDNNINISIFVNKDTLLKFSMCFSWSFGILSVNPPQFVKECKTGIWVNFSKYTPERIEKMWWFFKRKVPEKYDWLPQGTYQCVKEQVRCSEIKSNFCYLEGLEIPQRLQNSVDKCYEISKTLHPNETFSTDLSIDTLESINKDDYFEIYIIDKEKIKIGNDYVFSFSDGNKDVGIKDIVYRVDN